MSGLAAIVRLLMLLAALVPFNTDRQAVTTLAPYVPLTPPAPANDAPVPLEEDDDSETENGKERLAAPTRHRPEKSALIERLSASHPAPLPSRSSIRTTPSFLVDPFRNGLGTHYRC